MTEGFYETNKALSEYLLFHYGKMDEVLPCARLPGALRHRVRRHQPHPRRRPSS